MAQKEINEFGHDIARAGLIFGSNTCVINTGIIQEAVDAAGGFPVWGTKSTNDKCWAKKPASDGYFKGIVKDITFKQDGYEVGEPVSIVRQGQLWVQVSEDVNDGDEVYVDTATGAFLSAAGSSGEKIPNAYYTSSASADGFAVVQLL